MLLIYFNCASAFLHFQLEVVRSRNVQCLSFPLTVATLFTSASWVLYGLQVSDLYIVVRLTGCISIARLAPAKSVFFLYQTEMFSLVCISFRSPTPQESSPA